MIEYSNAHIFNKLHKQSKNNGHLTTHLTHQSSCTTKKNNQLFLLIKFRFWKRKHV